MTQRFIEEKDWSAELMRADGMAEYGVLVYAGNGNSRTSKSLLPVFVRHAGEGPTVLVVGGTHGDEFEGQIACTHLMRIVREADIAGTLIVLARHNPSACAAGQRTSPLDGIDMNRLYPASSRNGPSDAIAAFVTSRLLPGTDWLIDIHSGGRAHEFLAGPNLQATPGSAEDLALRPALKAFGAPHALIFDEGGTDVMPHAGTLESAARALGVKCLSSEIGGAGRLTPLTARLARSGLLNLLVHIGTLGAEWRTETDTATVFLRLDRPEHYLGVDTPCIFEPCKVLGEVVAIGDVVGLQHARDDLLAEPLPLKSRVDGVVAAVAATALLEAGDTAMMVCEYA